MNKFQLQYVDKGSKGGINYGDITFLDDTYTMRDALAKANEMAQKEGREVEVSAWNSMGRWKLITTFHCDGTATNAFGEHQRWTGGYGSYWAPVK